MIVIIICLSTLSLSSAESTFHPLGFWRELAKMSRAVWSDATNTEIYNFLFGPTPTNKPTAPPRFSGERQPPEPKSIPGLISNWVANLPENIPSKSFNVEEQCYVDGHIYESAYRPLTDDAWLSKQVFPRVTVVGTRKTTDECLVLGTYTMTVGWSDIEGEAGAHFPVHETVNCGSLQRVDSRYCHFDEEPWVTWKARAAESASANERSVNVKK
jgi:hypothetical protein